uniref:Uncharacterized protein n=1 Tax=Phlebotomus papatasi TaxID=29031 RepID=A0A1B0DDH6_PHLPP
MVDNPWILLRVCESDSRVLMILEDVVCSFLIAAALGDEISCCFMKTPIFAATMDCLLLYCFSIALQAVSDNLPAAPHNGGEKKILIFDMNPIVQIGSYRLKIWLTDETRSDTDSDERNDDIETIVFTEEYLRSWSVQNDISLQGLTQLLGHLRTLPDLKYLPSDGRSIMHTPRAAQCTIIILVDVVIYIFQKKRIVLLEVPGQILPTELFPQITMNPEYKIVKTIEDGNVFFCSYSL